MIQPTSPNAIIVDGEVLYDPFPLQLEAHLHTEPKVLVWGNRGGGKSKWGRWDCHMRALTYPGYKYCILRRTYPELEASHLIDLPVETRKMGGFFNSTKHIATYPNGSIGFYRHCQSDQDVLNLLSAEFHEMFFDEITTFEWEMFTKLSGSCRVPKELGYKALVRATTNPLGVSADQVDRYFVTKDITPDEDPKYDPNDWFSIKINAEDNPYLDYVEYHKSFAGNPEHVIKAWVLGEFGLENALFNFHPTKDGKPYHIIPSLDLNSLVTKAQIYRVFDMGYFPDPAYCAWIAHLGNRYIVFHEKLWYKTIASDIATDIKLEDERLGVKQVVITYCDPTMDIRTGADIRTIKDIFDDSGIAMECSINRRELFASHIHTALAEEAEPGIPRMQIYYTGRKLEIGCPYLAKTLPQMRYDPKRPLALDNHPQDHATVAVAYFLISSGAMERRTISTGPTIKPWMKEKNSARLILGSESVRDR
jgi:hypothetical protein